MRTLIGAGGVAFGTAETGDQPAASRRTRRVLVVQYPWYPVFNVAVKVAAKQCKHLREHGWEPVVLTKEWTTRRAAEDEALRLSWEPEREAVDAGPGIQVVRAAYSRRSNLLLSAHRRLQRVAERGGVASAASVLPRKALSAAWSLFGDFPDAYVGWASSAVEEGVAAVRRLGVEVILSTCPPQSAHVVASEISRRTGVPWIAQFGDLYGFWVGDGDWYGTSWRRAMARRANARWMGPASRVAAVSPAMLDYVSREYGKRGEVVVVGYDPDEWPDADPRLVAGDRLRLVHTGSIYPGDQRPELLFDALDLLLERDPTEARRLEILLVGSGRDAELRAMLSGRRAEEVVRVEARVSPDRAIELQRSAHALLLFNLTSSAAAGGTLSYPSKVFEYCRAGRPVLAVPADRGGFVDEILERTGCGRSASDAAAIAARLEGWLAEWRSAGELAHAPREDVVRSFSQREQARRLATMMDEAVAERARMW